MKLPPPPSAASTPAEIVQYEQDRGSDDWTGPQGNTDAWQLHADFWNQDARNIISYGSAIAADLGKIG
jgi:hypothetical protein